MKVSPDPGPDFPDTPREDKQPRRFRSPFAIRPRTLVIVGLLAIVGGLFGLRDHMSFLVSAEQAEAQVVSVETFDPTEGFTLYRPTIRYLTANGGMTATVADTYRPTEAGEMLSVAYDPANPADARLMDPRDRWILPLWMVVFGLITVVIGIRRARRVPPAEAD